MDREPQPLPEVVCLVFYKNGKVLLEQRLDDDEFYGRWTFTGGRIEKFDFIPGEDPKFVASKREGLEETNLIPQDLMLLATFEGISRNGGRYLFHGILITAWSGRLRNVEGLEKRKLRWVPVEQAVELIGDTEVDKKVLESFLEFINKYLNE